MSTKICTRCTLPKPATLEFFYAAKRLADGLSSHCKSCSAVNYNNSRKKKQAHYQAVAQKRRLGVKAQLDQYKIVRGCPLCPEKELCCLDPHHLDPSIKEDDVSALIQYSWKKVFEELVKCIIVCRNCHAKIHAGIISQSRVDEAYARQLTIKSSDTLIVSE